MDLGAKKEIEVTDGKPSSKLLVGSGPELRHSAAQPPPLGAGQERAPQGKARLSLPGELCRLHVRPV